MKEIDPKVFAEYQKTFGLDKASLESQIQSAGSRISAESVSPKLTTNEVGFCR